MSLISWIIISLILIIIVFIIYFIVKKIKDIRVKNILTKINNELMTIDEEKKEIEKEIERCEKISKNTKTKELLKNWQYEYVEMLTTIDELTEIEEQLQEVIKTKKDKNLSIISTQFIITAEELKRDMDVYYNKLKNYTKFELDNTQMAINLKERLKTANNIFDQKLKILDIFNNQFLETTFEINLNIKDFEEFQVAGDYPEARRVLKDGNEKLEILESLENKLIDLYDLFNTVENELSIVKSIQNKFEQYGYTNISEKVDLTYQDFLEKHDELEAELEVSDLKKHLIKTDEETLKKFIDEIKIYCDELETEFEKIEKIEKLKEANSELNNLVKELLQGALEEKDTIIKLYNIKEIDQFKKIESQKKDLDEFNEDYKTLNNMLFEEDVNLEDLYVRIEQSNKYLNRVLTNVKQSIKVLEAIRSDELEIRKNTETYKHELVKISIYLYKVKHFEKLNLSLKSTLKELSQKIVEMDKELEKEPLEISYVRANDNIIQKLLNNFINEMQKDVKQRVGAEKLAVHFNRFVVNNENYTFSTRFVTLYNNKEYRQILKEIYQVFTDNNPKGEALYRSILNSVNVEEYK